MLRHSILCRGGLILAFVLGTNPIATAACTSPQSLLTRLRAHPDANTYSELGTWFVERRQFVCASKAYRNALDLKPGSSRLSYLLGLSLYSAGNLMEAVPALQESTEIAPDVLKPHLLLAAALDALQRKSEAQVQWQAALKIDPHSTTALDGFARHLLDEKKYGEVVELLRPSAINESLTIDLAQAYIGLKRLDDAAEVLTAAFDKDPSSLGLANTLAAVYLKQVHYQAAEKLTEKTVRQQ